MECTYENRDSRYEINETSGQKIDKKMMVEEMGEKGVEIMRGKNRCKIQ